MKKLTLLLLLTLSIIGAKGQTTYQLNYGNIRYGLTNGTSNHSVFGNLYLKNLGVGASGDSILSIVNGLVKKVAKSVTVAQVSGLSDSLGNKPNLNRIPFVTPEQYGAVGDGSTNDYTALQNALNSGKHVFLSRKVYLTNTGLSAPAGSGLFGTSDSCIIKTNSNIDVITIAGVNVTLKNFGVYGNGGTSKGIVISGEIGIPVIDGIKASGLQYGFYIANSYIGYRTKIVSNSQAQNCTYGFFNTARGEYTSYSNCSATNNTYGWWNGAGNNSWTGGNISNNTINVRIQGGVGLNDGHSSITGATINHATTYAIIADSVQLGYNFTGNQIYYGKVLVKRSSLIKFEGNDFSNNDSLQFQNATNAEMNNNKIITSTVIDTLYGSQASAVKWFNNTYIPSVSSPPAQMYNKLYGQIRFPSLSSDRVVYLNTARQLTSSTVTSTELGYVQGVTSAIQTQLNTKWVGTAGSGQPITGLMYLERANTSASNGFVFKTASTFDWTFGTAVGTGTGSNLELYNYGTSTVNLSINKTTNAWAFTGSISAANLVSGTYTPTVFSGINTSGVTTALAHYKRVGNEVTVWGEANFTTTTGASTPSTIGVSLPIASNFTTGTDARGFGVAPGAAQNLIGNASVYADDTNDRATVGFYALSATGSGYLQFSFTYTVQ